MERKATVFFTKKLQNRFQSAKIRLHNSILRLQCSELNRFQTFIARSPSIENKFLHERNNGIIYLLVGGWYRV